MKTLLQIADYISKTTNSELNEINSINDIDPEQLNAINEATTLIWNYDPESPIRNAQTTFDTVIGQSDYPMPIGEIQKGGVKVAGNSTPLEFEIDKNYLADTSGTPCKYYIEGDDIVLHPTPSEVKTVTVKYLAEYPVKAADTTTKDFFDAATDVLNIPARLEKYFIACLAHLANRILNGDPTDEDYLEHDKNFIQFIRLVKNKGIGTMDNAARFVIS